MAFAFVWMYSGFKNIFQSVYDLRFRLTVHHPTRLDSSDSKHAVKVIQFQNNLWMFLNGRTSVLTSVQLSLFGETRRWLPTNIHHPTSQNWRGSTRRCSQRSLIQEWKPDWMIPKKTHRCSYTRCTSTGDEARAKGLNVYVHVIFKEINKLILAFG